MEKSKIHSGRNKNNPKGRKPRYKTQALHRCTKCGRVRGYMGWFKVCRICFRELANNGLLPGVKKASW